MIRDNPNLKHLLVHNIDTLGANADPVMLGYHIQQQKAMTVEVISRKSDDRGGGVAVSQLDGWSRDGSKDYITSLGLWE